MFLLKYIIKAEKYAYSCFRIGEIEAGCAKDNGRDEDISLLNLMLKGPHMIRWEPRDSLSFRVFFMLIVAASASVYDCVSYGIELWPKLALLREETFCC